MNHPFKLLIFTALAISLGGCSTFKVAPDEELSTAAVQRAQPIQTNIVLNVDSDLPDDLAIDFEDGFSTQTYNINSQVRDMYSDYVDIINNPSSDDDVTYKVTVNEFDVTNKAERGFWAQLSGMGSIDRAAYLKLTFVAQRGEQTLGQRTIEVAEGVNSSDGQRSTWMEAYTAAINKTINASIIRFDSFVKQTVP